MSDHPELVPGEPADEKDPPRITALTHAQGGMANETVLVDLGPSRPGLVVRLPPLEPTFPEYDLAPQAVVQNAVAASGVPAPAPAVVVTATRYLGAPFLVMPRVTGDIPGPAPLFDPYVRDAGPVLQRVMHDGLIDAMAEVHAVPWQGTALEQHLPGTGLGDAVDRWTGYVDWSSEGEPLPALVEAL
jgi:aminoglycoside phosphotransferase (APT) family kinase protein